MYIKSLSFTDKASGWTLEHIDFEKLSLLVGYSGVGKTRILDAIDCLQDIATGESFNGIMWELNFLDDEHNDIIWSGEIEYNKTGVDKRQFPLEIEEKVNPKKFSFVEEAILINGKVVAQRDKSGDIIFQDEKTVKLPKEQSLIFTLKEEDSIEVISKSLSKILILGSRPNGLIPSMAMDDDDPKTLESIQEARLTTSYKLLLAYHLELDVFEQIKNDFIEVFDFIGDIRFSPPEFKASLSKNPFLDVQVLQIKEKGSDTWVCDWQISSGMRKTLMLLASLYLSPEGSVILIDEFENSYGVNCLSPIIEYISSKDGFQFIMTSHHPYIIRNIDPKQWILIKRKGNIIEAKKVADDLSATSSHDKFLQLINLQDFEEGIVA